MNPANAERIVTVLKEFGFDLPDLSAELFLKEWQTVRLGVPPIRIEISTTISGVNFKECFAEKVFGKMGGEKVNLISLNHLKANKKASGRYQDLADLENLH